MFEIYGRTTCVWCDQAKQLLDSHDLDWVLYNVETSIEHLTRFKELFPGAKTVPQIVYNGGYIGGYTQLAEFLHGPASPVSKHS